MCSKKPSFCDFCKQGFLFDFSLFTTMGWGKHMKICRYCAGQDPTILKAEGRFYHIGKKSGP